MAYERRLWLGKITSLIEEETFERLYRPLRSRRKERQDFVFLPNRNGRFDKAISPAGILDNVCISHITWRIAQKKCGCFFESSVPIRKRLCVLGVFAVQKQITG